MAEFQLRRSKRNNGLPPKFPPIIGEGPMQAIDEGAATDSHVGENLVVAPWSVASIGPSPVVGGKTGGKPWFLLDRLN